MTAQPTRDQRAMWRQIATDAGDDPHVNTLHPDEVLALLDQLDQAEADSEKRGELVARALAVSETWRKRAVRAEAQSETRRLQAEYWQERARDLTQEVRDERGAARDQMEQVRIRDARIRAVEDVLDKAILRDGTEERELAHRIRRALDGGT